MGGVAPLGLGGEDFDRLSTERGPGCFGQLDQSDLVTQSFEQYGHEIESSLLKYIAMLESFVVHAELFLPEQITRVLESVEAQVEAIALMTQEDIQRVGSLATEQRLAALEDLNEAVDQSLDHFETTGFP